MKSIQIARHTSLLSVFILLASQLAFVGSVQAEAQEKEKPEYQKLFDAWKYPEAVPNFELLDENGEKFRLHEFKGSYVMLGFIFTRCGVKEACPLTTRKMKQVQELWKKKIKNSKLKKEDLQLLTLTFDPEYDRPPVMKKYAGKYNADLENWTFATGPTKLMHDLLPALFNVVAYPDRQVVLTHNIKAALLAPNLRDLEYFKDNDFDPKEVLKAIDLHQEGKIKVKG